MKTPLPFFSRPVGTNLFLEVGEFSDVAQLGRQIQILNKSKQRKIDDLIQLEAKSKILRNDLQSIETKIQQISESIEKSTCASSVLIKSIEQYPIHDLFNETKLKVIKSRVQQTKKIISEEKLKLPVLPDFDRPTLKKKYKFRFKFGSEGKENGHLQNPRVCAIDGAGNLWIADTLNDRIQVHNKDGIWIKTLGEKGSGDGQFNNPSAVTFDFDGNVVVVDSGKSPPTPSSSFSFFCPFRNHQPSSCIKILFCTSFSPSCPIFHSPVPFLHLTDFSFR